MLEEAYDDGTLGRGVGGDGRHGARRCPTRRRSTATSNALTEAARVRRGGPLRSLQSHEGGATWTPSSRTCPCFVDGFRMTLRLLRDRRASARSSSAPSSRRCASRRSRRCAASRPSTPRCCATPRSPSCCSSARSCCRTSACALDYFVARRHRPHGLHLAVRRRGDPLGRQRRRRSARPRRRAPRARLRADRSASSSCRRRSAWSSRRSSTCSSPSPRTPRWPAGSSSLELFASRGRSCINNGNVDDSRSSSRSRSSTSSSRSRSASIAGDLEKKVAVLR